MSDAPLHPIARACAHLPTPEIRAAVDGLIHLLDCRDGDCDREPDPAEDGDGA